MTNVDAIYVRHQRSLMAVDRADDVVLFSLRLALEELSSQPIPSTPSTDQRQAERTAAQLERLNDWLAMYEPSEYAAPGDTADAVLCVLNRQRTEIAEIIDSIIDASTAGSPSPSSATPSTDDPITRIADALERIADAQEALARAAF